MDRAISLEARRIDLSIELPFQLGPARVDPPAHEITIAAAATRFQPQTLKVLVALHDKIGEVVTRDELIDRCWDGRIVGEDVINRCISILRRFAADAGGFRIETVPRAGYRLVQPQPRRPTTRAWIGAAAALPVAAAAIWLLSAPLSHGVQPAPKTLVVLPFAAQDGDDNLADGLSEELISNLAQNRDLRVIGRTSAWQYKGKAVDLRTIGQQLGVDYVVEGDVSRVGDHLRVVASLVRARDGTAMWSRIYRASSQQSPWIEESIGSALVAALGLSERAIAVVHKPQGEAYTLYLSALPLFRERTTPAMESARTLLLQAIGIDPKFAPAWAYAGGITNLLDEDRFSLDPTRRGAPSITPRQALEHALMLDPNLAVAHGFLGWIAGPYDREGYRHLVRAVELAPNDPQILYWYSNALYRYGDFARFAQVARRDAMLDPLWQRPVEAAASVSLWEGDEKAVRRYIDTIRAVNPDGALEVESSIATQSGDLSRSIQIALSDKRRPFQLSTTQAATNLIELGFEREGRLVGDFGPQAALYDSGNVPDRATMLKLGPLDYGTALYQLRMHGRYPDVVALYDASQREMGEIRKASYFNRQLLCDFGGPVAQALKKVGRTEEAQNLLVLAKNADAAIIASGKEMPPSDLLCIAANESVAGSRDDAIHHLQEAALRGQYIAVNVDGAIDPVWENLRGDARFSRLAQISFAYLRQERRKVLALHVL